MTQSMFIGQSSFKGSFVNYAQKLNLLELLAEPHRLPKVKQLAEYRKQAPEGFEFSVVLAPGATIEGGKALFDYGLDVSKALGARWIVVRPPASVRPGSSSERLLANLFEQVRARSPESQIAWEPRGLWEGKSRHRLAEAWGVTLVSDVHDVAPADVVYARMLRLGTGARTSVRLLEKLALSLVQARLGYVVVDGGPAVPVRRELEEIITEAMNAEDEDDDAEFEGLEASGDADEGEDADDADDDGEDADDADEGDADDEGDAEEGDEGGAADGDDDDDDDDDGADGPPPAPARGRTKGRR